MSEYQEAERETEREAGRETSRTGAALVLESGARAAQGHLSGRLDKSCPSVLVLLLP